MRNKYEIDEILNMDETPVHLNMPTSTTIEKIEKRNVIIKTKTQVQEKYRVTCVLIIKVNGEKLSSLLIFKGKPEKRVEKKLNIMPEVQDQLVYAYTQNNAWNDEKIMIKYINNLLKYWINEKTLLIMDAATSHKTDNVIEVLEELNVDHVFIPKGLINKL